MTLVFRFAPSPNGRLHLGHAYSALLNQTLAEAHQGRFLVRLEDIDTTRCTPELARLCLEDLHWLGLRWEEPVRVQSEHLCEYRAQWQALARRGLLYPCFCSRKDIAVVATHTDPDGAPLYPGTCRQLSEQERRRRIAEGQPHSWRLDSEKALKTANKALTYTRFTPEGARESVPARPQLWGDAIIARKDILTSYHLSVVWDDALQGVTHVVRGADLEAATCLHVLLQTLLDLPTPLYYHHPLLTDASGGKLSKSRFSETLADLRARGMTAGDARALVLQA